MASLQRIEELDSRLNGKEPAWIRGYPDKKREQHLSGALREMADEVMSNPDLSLDDIEMDIRYLLSEAAETLDDAHEEWLNTQLAARDLCGDIEAMRTPDPESDDEKTSWFGNFTESYDDWSGFGLQVSGRISTSVRSI